MPDLHSIESSLAPLRWNKARVKLLAAVVVALLSAQSINLAKLALLMPTDAKVSSAYKRLQRFLADFAPGYPLAGDGQLRPTASLVVPSRPALESCSRPHELEVRRSASEPSDAVHRG